MKTNRVIAFLQRKDARETWEYERVVILLLELACLVAGVIASPSHTTMLLMAIDLPRSLYATELARAVRSGAARKAERARAMGIPEVELICSRDIERAAKNQQLMTAAQPVVGLALSVAGSGQGFTRAIIVGFIVSVIRWASVESYGVWRAWYRERVPVQVVAMTRNHFEAVLVEETEALLGDMRQRGFFYRGELRFDATTWDINNGRCDDFAEAVAERVPGAESVPASAFGSELAHQVVLFGGRFYDAECHAGVARLEDLPIARNHGRSRADVTTIEQLSQVKS